MNKNLENAFDTIEYYLDGIHPVMRHNALDLFTKLKKEVDRVYNQFDSYERIKNLTDWSEAADLYAEINHIGLMSDYKDLTNNLIDEYRDQIETTKPSVQLVDTEYVRFVTEVKLKNGFEFTVACETCTDRD